MSANPQKTTAAVPHSDRQKEAGNELVFSYLTMRNLIGVCGLLLPVVLVLTTGRGATDRAIEPSISDYYYTSNGDVLVVMLSVLGVFLFTYTGYKWQENVLTTIAAIAAIGVAFSPVTTLAPNSLSIHIGRSAGPMWAGVERHFVFAFLFFVSLALITLLYFTRSDKTLLTTPKEGRSLKEKRNSIYKLCGWTILLCVALLGVHFLLQPLPPIAGVPPVFFFESIAIEAFGLSWITKGETLWPDGEHYVATGYRLIKEKMK